MVHVLQVTVVCKYEATVVGEGQNELVVVVVVGGFGDECVP